MANNIFGIYADDIVEDYQNAKVKKDYVKRIAKEYGVSTMKVADFLNKRGVLTRQQLAAYVRYATDYQDKKEFDRYKAEVVKEYEREGKLPKKDPEPEQTVAEEPTVVEEAPQTVAEQKPTFIDKIVKDWLKVYRKNYEELKESTKEALDFISLYEQAEAEYGGEAK